ncbi:MAG TPA: hypothetical protein VFS67_15755 [Polyangiaceae bacterium]|jgi:hypothetical protein|nr:hypothetical protein [Polyangiaceae bacterium]
MIANQTSRGLHRVARQRVACQSAARCIGLLVSSVALLAACGGTIEQTEVDQQHLEMGSNGKQLSKPAEASSPAPKPAAASNATAASNTPAAKPAATPDPEPADEEDPPATDDDEDADAPTTTNTASADLSFNTDIWPIFSKSCSPCHAGGGAGGQDVGGSDKSKALEDAKRIETKLISDLSTGRMPIGCAKPPGGGGTCVSEDDFADIKAWYEAGSPP